MEMSGQAHRCTWFPPPDSASFDLRLFTRRRSRAVGTVTLRFERTKLARLNYRESYSVLSCSTGHLAANTVTIPVRPAGQYARRSLNLYGHG